MSKFYVGQRVRIVDAPAYPELVGEVTCIVEIDSSDEKYFAQLEIRGGMWAMACQIEPLRDDDTNTVTSWEQCVWKPAGVRA